MINWRSIKEVGFPTDESINYLVTDGKNISVSAIACNHYFKDNNHIIKFSEWTGDENVWEENSCCSGTRVFDMNPTHYCPVTEINLPEM